jgi:hypothetical protein
MAEPVFNRVSCMICLPCTVVVDKLAASISMLCPRGERMTGTPRRHRAVERSRDQSRAIDVQEDGEM